LLWFIPSACLFVCYTGVHKVFWEERRVSGLRGSVIDFDGTPFAMKRTVIMDCYHGQDHHVAEKKKLKERMEKSDVRDDLLCNVVL
jgi:hypothetical protein